VGLARPTSFAVSTQRRKGARAQRLKLGLVVNFGERLVKDGIHRVVTRLQPQGTRRTVALAGLESAPSS
jgi:hypothetical protein